MVNNLIDQINVIIKKLSIDFHLYFLNFYVSLLIFFRSRFDDFDFEVELEFRVN